MPCTAHSSAIIVPGARIGERRPLGQCVSLWKLPLRGEAEPETDGREGLKSLEVLIATYLSARDGRRVALPLDY
jgi:predicted dehydrogenase